MTIGVGGSTAEKELAAMTSMRGDVPPIGVEERLKRIARAQAIMREKGIDALHLDVSSSMVYFTGLNFRRTERMHSAVLPGERRHRLRLARLRGREAETMMSFGDKIAVWEEDEDPTAVVTETVRSLGYPNGTIAVDQATPFFTFDGLRRAGNSYSFVNGDDVTAGCRMIKSEQEIALIRRAKNMTLEVHKAAARIMREGITTTEVQAFIAAAHKKLGSDGLPTFNARAVRRGDRLPARRARSADAQGRRHDADRHRRAASTAITPTSRAPTCSASRPQRQREIWDLEKQRAGGRVRGGAARRRLRGRSTRPRAA